MSSMHSLVNKVLTIVLTLVTVSDAIDCVRRLWIFFFLVSIITVVVHLSALLRFILLLALRVLNACLCFAVRLEKVVEAISSFVRSV